MCVHVAREESLWRNRLARSAVNRKVDGSNPEWFKSTQGRASQAYIIKPEESCFAKTRSNHFNVWSVVFSTV